MNTERKLKIVQALNDATTIITVLQPLLTSAVLTGRAPTDEEVDAALAECGDKIDALGEQIEQARAAGG